MKKARLGTCPALPPRHPGISRSKKWMKRESDKEMMLTTERGIKLQRREETWRRRRASEAMERRDTWDSMVRGWVLQRGRDAGVRVPDGMSTRSAAAGGRDWCLDVTGAARERWLTKRTRGVEGPTALKLPFVYVETTEPKQWWSWKELHQNYWEVRDDQSAGTTQSNDTVLEAGHSRKEEGERSSSLNWRARRQWHFLQAQERQRTLTVEGSGKRAFSVKSQVSPRARWKHTRGRNDWPLKGLVPAPVLSTGIVSTQCELIFSIIDCTGAKPTIQQSLSHKELILVQGACDKTNTTWIRRK